MAEWFKFNYLPAALEPGAETLVGGALRGFADRARDGDAVEQLLLCADFAQPFVVVGRQGLAGREAGAGVGDAEPGRLVGLVAAYRAADDTGYRHDALLDQIVVVLQGERILLVERQRFAQGGAELALVLAGIEAGFHRGLVPDRADAGCGDRRPGGAGRLRHAAAIRQFFRQHFRGRQRALPGDRHVGADPRVQERRDRLLDRDGRRAVRLGVRRPRRLGAGVLRRVAPLRGPAGQP